MRPGAASDRVAQPGTDASMPHADRASSETDDAPNVAPPARSRRRAIVVGTIEIALSAGLLWIVFSRLDHGEVTARLDQLSYFSAALAVLPLLLHAALSAIRWRAILAYMGA